MPRPAKRRQADAGLSQPITRFTRVSKTAIPEAPLKKAALSAPSKKRKAAPAEIDENPRLTRRTISFPPSSDEDEVIVSKRACRREQQPEPTPATTRRRPASRPSKPVSTPKKTRQTKLDSHVKSIPKAEEKNVFPQQLAELVDLHRAFVTAFMLHVAHSRSTAPVDVRSIAPNISMAWGKRQVTVEDIQRCIAIQSSAKYGYTSPFIVSDYGRGKICVEIDSQHNAAGINEDRLCKQFEESLRHICTERTVDEMTDVDITFENLSLADLPKAAIKNKDLGLNANPMLAKGQRTLSSLKSDLATREQEKQAKQEALSNNPMLNPDGSKMSLLDRIRLKQLVKDNGPVPPSGPELQRRAALNRVMDVSATLSMLSLSNPVSLPRQAFSMAAVMDRLKDSLRMPISKEEATTCIRLLATEVAPEWIRIVALGGRENVVLQRNMQPVDRVLNERVQKLLG
ncbi:unnamed protein product [Clonostachys rosea f. rosea IK726]|jgi:hypothetical protein|uniref:DNA replication factor Cdt1 C-terminal domain-containing protein n=2 Tax=Bionectria ochroleuca TaxID=29856 RepID=A0A0B7KDW4_BIOOC|nr:unnamed protein product [Clonostachys rosea f. rosea IK726]